MRYLANQPAGRRWWNTSDPGDKGRYRELRHGSITMPKVRGPHSGDQWVVNNGCAAEKLRICDAMVRSPRLATA
jgi:hypothetical protein